jgi:RNA 2',3'-cyclic 3'-phosphodiesterase
MKYNKCQGKKFYLAYTGNNRVTRNMSVIRAFIAIALPRTVQLKLDEVAHSLKNEDTQAVRWMAGKNIHLTLKFLGEVEQKKIEAVSQAIQLAAQHFNFFELSAGGVGTFPNLRRPRVIWVGVQAPEPLAGLANAIDLATQSLGFPGEERAFSPHLTLGRVSQNASPLEVQSVAQALSRARIGDLGSFPVTQVTLFRSDLQPSGAIYTPLFAASLNNPG